MGVLPQVMSDIKIPSGKLGEWFDILSNIVQPIVVYDPDTLNMANLIIESNQDMAEQIMIEMQEIAPNFGETEH